MTDFPTSDKAAAKKAQHEAESAWRADAEANAVRWAAELKAAAGDNPALAAVIDLHAVEVNEWSERPIQCAECFDHEDAYYDRGRSSWPCKTIRAMLDHLSAGEPPKPAPYPTWDDFYREPDVTITLAHHTKIHGRYHAPREQLTLPLSQATRLRYRMTHESWTTVERMNRQ